MTHSGFHQLNMQGFLAAFLSLALIALAGCDTLAEKAGLDRVEVPLGSAGRDLPVEPGATVKSSTVEREGGDLPDVFDAESITIQKGNVTYTPATAGKASASGTIGVFLIVEEAPTAGTSVSIVDDAVESIDPSEISIANYDKDRFANCLGQFSEEDQPALRENYADLTVEQTTEIVNEALKASTFNAAVVACVSDDLNGSLSVDKAVVNLDF